MECLFGIAGPTFCLLAADTTVARSIVVMKPEHHKHAMLTSTCAMCFSGEPGDAANYAEFVQRNCQLERWRWEGRELGVHEAAAFARKTLADSVRSRSPYNVNVLVGGVDGVTGGGQLYWMDYLGTLCKVPFAAHGYGAYFCTGLMDSRYREGLSEQEALDLLKACLAELKQRFVANLPLFHVKIIRADGTVSDLTLSAY